MGADCFCHAIMASAIVGLVFQFFVAAVRWKLKQFCLHFLICYDTIENHGVTGEGELLEPHAVVKHAQCSKHARIALTWFFFSITLCCCLLSLYFPSMTPAFVEKATDFLGMFCWCGIAWWMVSEINALCRLLNLE